MVDRNNEEIKVGDRLWVNKPVTVNQYGDEIHDMWNPTIEEIGVDKHGEEYLIAYDNSKRFKFKQSQMFWDETKHQDGVCKDLVNI
jgi:hypothetical protein